MRLMPLRRCWFDFKGADVASGIRGGFGVSALHRADALELLRASVGSVAEPLLVVENIDSRLWTPDMTRPTEARTGAQCPDSPDSGGAATRFSKAPPRSSASSSPAPSP